MLSLMLLFDEGDMTYIVLFETLVLHVDEEVTVSRNYLSQIWCVNAMPTLEKSAFGAPDAGAIVTVFHPIVSANGGGGSWADVSKCVKEEGVASVIACNAFGYNARTVGETHVIALPRDGAAAILTHAGCWWDVF